MLRDNNRLVSAARRTPVLSYKVNSHDKASVLVHQAAAWELMESFKALYYRFSDPQLQLFW